MKRQGRCFELSARHLLDEHRGWTLVHGYAQLVQKLPLLLAHAWLEKGNTVFDPTQEEPLIRRGRYRRLFRARAVKRYQLREVRKLLLEHGHWGPWDTRVRHDVLPLTGAPTTRELNP